MISKENQFHEYKEYLTSLYGIDVLLKKFKNDNRQLSKYEYADLLTLIPDTNLMTYAKNKILKLNLIKEYKGDGKRPKVKSAKEFSTYHYKDVRFSFYLEMIDKKLSSLRNREDIRDLLNLMNASDFPQKIIYAYFAIFLYKEGAEEFNKYRLSIRNTKLCQSKIHLIHMDCSLNIPTIQLVRIVKEIIKPAYIIINNNVGKDVVEDSPKETPASPVIRPILDKSEIIEIEANWDDISFDSKAIEIMYPKAYQQYDFRTYSSKRFFHADSRVWMNYIKPLLAQQIGKVRIKINYTRVLEVLTEFNIKKFIDTWNPIVNVDSYEFVPAWKLKAINNNQTYTDNDKYVSMAEKINFKNRFISTLCKIHDKNEKVLTVEENLQWSKSSTKERVFIFTVSQNETYCKIIYENVNIARSTYVCKVLRSRYKLAINSIIDYFSSSFVNKRTDMISHSVVIKGVSSIKILKHNNPHEWLSRIKDTRQ